MAFFTYKNIKINAVAASVPTELISVDSFVEKNGEETVEKFKAMTGIREFRRARPHQTASDLGYAAAEEMLDDLEELREMGRQTQRMEKRLSKLPRYKRRLYRFFGRRKSNNIGN